MDDEKNRLLSIRYKTKKKLKKKEKNGENKGLRRAFFANLTTFSARAGTREKWQARAETRVSEPA